MKFKKLFSSILLSVSLVSVFTISASADVVWGTDFSKSYKVTGSTYEYAYSPYYAEASTKAKAYIGPGYASVEIQLGDKRTYSYDKTIDSHGYYYASAVLTGYNVASSVCHEYNRGTGCEDLIRIYR